MDDAEITVRGLVPSSGCTIASNTGHNDILITEVRGNAIDHFSKTDCAFNKSCSEGNIKLHENISIQPVYCGIRNESTNAAIQKPVSAEKIVKELFPSQLQHTRNETKCQDYSLADVSKVPKVVPPVVIFVEKKSTVVSKKESCLFTKALISSDDCGSRKPTAGVSTSENSLKLVSDCKQQVLTPIPFGEENQIQLNTNGSLRKVTSLNQPQNGLITNTNVKTKDSLHPSGIFSLMDSKSEEVEYSNRETVKVKKLNTPTEKSLPKVTKAKDLPKQQGNLLSLKDIKQPKKILCGTDISSGSKSKEISCKDNNLCSTSPNTSTDKSRFSQCEKNRCTDVRTNVKQCKGRPCKSELAKDSAQLKENLCRADTHSSGKESFSQCEENRCTTVGASLKKSKERPCKPALTKDSDSLKKYLSITDTNSSDKESSPQCQEKSTALGESLKKSRGSPYKPALKKNSCSVDTNSLSDADVDIKKRKKSKDINQPKVKRCKVEVEDLNEIKRSLNETPTENIKFKEKQCSKGKAKNINETVFNMDKMGKERVRKLSKKFFSKLGDIKNLNKVENNLCKFTKVKDSAQFENTKSCNENALSACKSRSVKDRNHTKEMSYKAQRLALNEVKTDICEISKAKELKQLKEKCQKLENTKNLNQTKECLSKSSKTDSQPSKKTHCIRDSGDLIETARDFSKLKNAKNCNQSTDKFSKINTREDTNQALVGSSIVGVILKHQVQSTGNLTGATNVSLTKKNLNKITKTGSESNSSSIKGTKGSHQSRVTKSNDSKLSKEYLDKASEIKHLAEQKKTVYSTELSEDLSGLERKKDSVLPKKKLLKVIKVTDFAQGKEILNKTSGDKSLIQHNKRLCKVSQTKNCVVSEKSRSVQIKCKLSSKSKIPEYSSKHGSDSETNSSDVTLNAEGMPVSQTKNFPLVSNNETVSDLSETQEDVCSALKRKISENTHDSHFSKKCSVGYHKKKGEAFLQRIDSKNFSGCDKSKLSTSVQNPNVTDSEAKASGVDMSTDHSKVCFKTVKMKPASDSATDGLCKDLKIIIKRVKVPETAESTVANQSEQDAFEKGSGTDNCVSSSGTPSFSVAGCDETKPEIPVISESLCLATSGKVTEVDKGHKRIPRSEEDAEKGCHQNRHQKMGKKKQKGDYESDRNAEIARLSLDLSRFNWLEEKIKSSNKSESEKELVSGGQMRNNNDSQNRISEDSASEELKIRIRKQKRTEKHKCDQQGNLSKKRKRKHEYLIEKESQSNHSMKQSSPVQKVPSLCRVVESDVSVFYENDMLQNICETDGNSYANVKHIRVSIPIAMINPQTVQRFADQRKKSPSQSCTKAEKQPSKKEGAGSKAEIKNSEQFGDHTTLPSFKPEEMETAASITSQDKNRLKKYTSLSKITKLTILLMGTKSADDYFVNYHRMKALSISQNIWRAVIRLSQYDQRTVQLLSVGKTVSTGSLQHSALPKNISNSNIASLLSSEYQTLSSEPMPQDCHVSGCTKRSGRLVRSYSWSALCEGFTHLNITDLNVLQLKNLFLSGFSEEFSSVSIMKLPNNISAVQNLDPLCSTGVNLQKFVTDKTLKPSASVLKTNILVSQTSASTNSSEIFGLADTNTFDSKTKTVLEHSCKITDGHDPVSSSGGTCNPLAVTDFTSQVTNDLCTKIPSDTHTVKNFFYVIDDTVKEAPEITVSDSVLQSSNDISLEVKSLQEGRSQFNKENSVTVAENFPKSNPNDSVKSSALNFVTVGTHPLLATKHDVEKPCEFSFHSDQLPSVDMSLKNVCAIKVSDKSVKNASPVEIGEAQGKICDVSNDDDAKVLDDESSSSVRDHPSGDVLTEKCESLKKRYKLSFGFFDDENILSKVGKYVISSTSNQKNQASSTLEESDQKNHVSPTSGQSRKVIPEDMIITISDDDDDEVLIEKEIFHKQNEHTQSQLCNPKEVLKEADISPKDDTNGNSGIDVLYEKYVRKVKEYENKRFSRENEIKSENSPIQSKDEHKEPPNLPKLQVLHSDSGGQFSDMPELSKEDCTAHNGSTIDVKSCSLLGQQKSTSLVETGMNSGSSTLSTKKIKLDERHGKSTDSLQKNDSAKLLHSSELKLITDGKPEVSKKIIENHCRTSKSITGRTTTNYPTISLKEQIFNSKILSDHHIPDECGEISCEQIPEELTVMIIDDNNSVPPKVPQDILVNIDTSIVDCFEHQRLDGSTFLVKDKVEAKFEENDVLNYSVSTEKLSSPVDVGKDFPNQHSDSVGHNFPNQHADSAGSINSLGQVSSTNNFAVTQINKSVNCNTNEEVCRESFPSKELEVAENSNSEAEAEAVLHQKSVTVSDINDHSTQVKECMMIASGAYKNVSGIQHKDGSPNLTILSVIVSTDDSVSVPEANSSQEIQCSVNTNTGEASIQGSSGIQEIAVQQTEAKKHPSSKAKKHRSASDSDGKSNPRKVKRSRQTECQKIAFIKPAVTNRRCPKSSNIQVQQTSQTEVSRCNTTAPSSLFQSMLSQSAATQYAENQSSLQFRDEQNINGFCNDLVAHISSNPYLTDDQIEELQQIKQEMQMVTMLERNEMDEYIKLQNLQLSKKRFLDHLRKRLSVSLQKYKAKVPGYNPSNTELARIQNPANDSYQQIAENVNLRFLSFANLQRNQGQGLINLPQSRVAANNLLPPVRSCERLEGSQFSNRANEISPHHPHKPIALNQTETIMDNAAHVSHNLPQLQNNSATESRNSNIISNSNEAVNTFLTARNDASAFASIVREPNNHPTNEGYYSCSYPYSNNTQNNTAQTPLSVSSLPPRKDHRLEPLRCENRTNKSSLFVHSTVKNSQQKDKHHNIFTPAILSRVQLQAQEPLRMSTMPSVLSSSDRNFRFPFQVTVPMRASNDHQGISLDYSGCKPSVAQQNFSNEVGNLQASFTGNISAQIPGIPPSAFRPSDADLTPCSNLSKDFSINPVVQLCSLRESNNVGEVIQPVPPRSSPLISPARNSPLTANTNSSHHLHTSQLPQPSRRTSDDGKNVLTAAIAKHGSDIAVSNSFSGYTAFLKNTSGNAVCPTTSSHKTSAAALQLAAPQRMDYSSVSERTISTPGTSQVASCFKAPDVSSKQVPLARVNQPNVFNRATDLSVSQEVSHYPTLSVNSSVNLPVNVNHPPISERPSNMSNMSYFASQYKTPCATSNPGLAAYVKHLNNSKEVSGIPSPLQGMSIYKTPNSNAVFDMHMNHPQVVYSSSFGSNISHPTVIPPVFKTMPINACSSSAPNSVTRIQHSLSTNGRQVLPNANSSYQRNSDVVDTLSPFGATPMNQSSPLVYKEQSVNMPFYRIQNPVHGAKEVPISQEGPSERVKIGSDFPYLNSAAGSATGEYSLSSQYHFGSGPNKQSNSTQLEKNLKKPIEEAINVDLLPEQHCARCLKVAYSMCIRCQQVWYCSKECQSLHWKKHMAFCMKRKSM